jgi:hypothetical protein
MNLPSYYLIEDHEPTGPHSVSVLLQKAEIFVITPDTAVKPAEPPEALWVQIHELPELRALLFPAKKTLNLRTFAPFKATPEIEARHEPVHVEDMLRNNTLNQIAAEDLKPRRLSIGPRQRRNRTFLISALVINVPSFLAFCLMTAEVPAMVIAPTLAAIATVILYWFMYHLMS